MTLRRVCSNRQSTVIWGEEGWPNHHITFIVAKKKLNLQFILLYLRYMWGRGFVENVIWVEGGWLKTPEYRHTGGRGLKLLKNRQMIFERSPTYPVNCKRRLEGITTGAI